MQLILLAARAFVPLMEAQPPPDRRRPEQLYWDTSAQEGSPRLSRWQAGKYWWRPKTPCTMQWQSQDAIPAGETVPMTTYALSAHDGALCAAGIGGVLCRDAGAAEWQTLQSGFSEPTWLGSPIVVSLASSNNGLYAVMANSAGPRLYRLAGGSTVWEAQWDAPDGARSLLADSGVLYLGTTSGVSVYEEAAEGWYPVGQVLPATVSTLAPVGAEVLAGTFAGDVIRYNPATMYWECATAPLPSTHIFAIQEYGEYLYVGGNMSLSRCWTETGVWDTSSLCESIEPETGFPADLVAIGFQVHKAQLYVATPKGIKRFDAVNDQWESFNTGLVDAAALPLHTFGLTTFDGHLVAGTIDGVYQYGCW